MSPAAMLAKVWEASSLLSASNVALVIRMTGGARSGRRVCGTRAARGRCRGRGAGAAAAGGAGSMLLLLTVGMWTAKRIGGAGKASTTRFRGM